MPAPDTKTDPERRLADAKTEVFGDNPVLGPDGEPIEKGSGSAYARMTPAARAHYQAVSAHAAMADVTALAKQLLDAVGRLTSRHKLAVDATEKAAKAEQPGGDSRGPSAPASATGGDKGDKPADTTGGKGNRAPAPGPANTTGR